MATNLEYIYRLKDQYTKRLEAITKAQLRFSAVHSKSMGKINSATIHHTRLIEERSMAHRRTMGKMNSAVSHHTRLLREQATASRIASSRQIPRLQQILSMRQQITRATNKSSSSMLAGLNRTSNAMSHAIGGMFNLRNSIMAVGVSWLAWKTLNFPIKQAAFLEDQLISYQVKLGGNEAAAKKLVKQLNILGAETPFNFSHLARATDMLLGMGDITKDNIITRMRMLGDISQGDPEKLRRIALAYSQILSAGKLQGQDRLQLINAGVPINAMAKSLGMTMKRFTRLQGQGKITGVMVTKAFQKMTGQGGLFFNMMIKKSKTFNGLTSTLKDNIDLTWQAIGLHMLPFAKKLVIRLTEVTENIRNWVGNNKKLLAQKIGDFFKGIGKVLEYVIANYEMLLTRAKWLAIGIGALMAVNFALKASLLAVTAAQILWKAAVFAFYTPLYLIQGLTYAWIAAQWLLNAAMSANPISLVVIAIAALIGLLTTAIFKTETLGDAFQVMGGIMIKSFLDPINYVVLAIRGMLFAMSKIPGAGGIFKTAYDDITQKQEKINLALTGNKSATSLGMIYDLVTKDKPSEISTWASDPVKKAAEKRSQSSSTTDVNVTGNIGVEATEGTNIPYSNFNFDVGTNMNMGT